MNKVRNFKEYISEGVDDQGIFKAVFLAGGPGSGKSFVAKNTLPPAIFGLKVVNSDDSLEYLLKKNQIPADMNTMSAGDLERFVAARDRAKDITKSKEKLYIQGRLGLIIDGTGRDHDKISRKRQDLANIGYDTYMIFVNTSLDVALKRNLERERKVAEDLVIRYWKDVQSNIGKFQNTFGGSNFIIVDNNSTNDDLLLKVFKGIKKFIDAKPRSEEARKWIAANGGKV
jgi:predicted kinase